MFSFLFFLERRQINAYYLKINGNMTEYKMQNQFDKMQSMTEYKMQNQFSQVQPPANLISYAKPLTYKW